MFLQLMSVCSCFVILFANVLARQPSLPPILNADVDAFINDLLSDWNSPGGVSVAVVRKTGNDTWNVETKGYGVAKADGTNVTAQTLFAIGSNSKLFDILATGLLIANISLDPCISWNTKIKTIIPEWGLMDPVASDEATIIDLMSHRSGLPPHDFMAALTDDVLDVIGRLRFLKPSTEFREMLQYNNNMYAVLSYIPTAVLPSKPNFTRYVKDSIFEPLGLNSTTYSFDVANGTGNLADGFFKQRSNLSTSPFDVGITRAVPFWAQAGGEDGHLYSGAGGVISNAVDMASWLQTLLSGGQNAVTREVIIPPDAINMVSSGITVFDGIPQQPFLSAVIYGGGQIQTTYRGHVVVEHGGILPGFKSYVSRYPFDGVGISVLTNDNELGTAISIAIKYRLSDQALGLTLIASKAIVGNDLLATFGASPSPIQRLENATLPPNGVEGLVGLYEDPAYGRMELCLASVNTSTVITSDNCQALTSKVEVILPGVVDPTVPTLVAKWDRPFGAYLCLSHLNESSFSLSVFNSYPTGNSSSPFWASPVVISAGSVAEFAQDNGTMGFGLTGIWGAGAGVPEPMGKTVKERSEIWFTKVSD